MHLTNLDAETRRYMREEVERDIAAGNLYLGNRLSPTGRVDYPDLLRDAVDHGDTASFAAALNSASRLNDTETVVRKGTPYDKAVPVTAAETMAEGELNRFYARGLALRALADGQTELRVYRAKPVASPRSESVRMEGTAIDAQALLDDLRTHQGMDTALGLPPGPNSGLSVELIT